MKVRDIDSLMSIIESKKPDAIVVEGYDGVGKGRLLNILSERIGVIPYRPDYNLWQKYDHRPQDRWKVSGFFWDIMNHFNIHTEKPMLFDRGVLSGAVYNGDTRIAYDYKQLISNMKVLHILVICNTEDYVKFLKVRNPSISPEEISKEKDKYVNMSLKYSYLIEGLGFDYIIYVNLFSENEEENVCKSCGHYNYGWCRHPEINKEVDPCQERCEHSLDKEVQDIVN